MLCEYFLLIRRQQWPFLLANDDGLSLAGQHAGRGSNSSSVHPSICVFVYALPFESVVWSRSILGLGLPSSSNGNCE